MSTVSVLVCRVCHLIQLQTALNSGVQQHIKADMEIREAAVLRQQRRIKQAIQFLHKDSADLLPLDGLNKLGTSKEWVRQALESSLLYIMFSCCLCYFFLPRCIFLQQLQQKICNPVPSAMQANVNLWAADDHFYFAQSYVRPIRQLVSISNKPQVEFCFSALGTARRRRRVKKRYLIRVFMSQ